MPIYEFMTDSGKLIEKRFSVAEMPEVGRVVTLEDPDTGEPVEATRIFSMPSKPTEMWKPYVSSRLPRNLEGVPCTPSGKPIITSQAQERNICARFGYERE